MLASTGRCAGVGEQHLLGGTHERHRRDRQTLGIAARLAAAFGAIVCGLLLASPAARTQPSPPPPVATSVQASPALQTRIGQLADVLAGEYRYGRYFASAFRNTMPEPRFRFEMAALVASYGPVLGIAGMEPLSPDAATVRLGFRDAVVTLQIAVETHKPHRVSSLRLVDIDTPEKTLGEVLAALKSLRGVTGFAFVRLGAGEPEPVLSHYADRPFAVASTFKLLILAELVRATNAGERNWDDRVTLDGARHPDGGFTQRSAGTRVSLRELATQMISVSDNGATDVLLKALGREKVEAMLSVAGVGDPARNRPFLSTIEMIKLKGTRGLAARYLMLETEAERRSMLESEVAGSPLSALNRRRARNRTPVLIDRLEWFFTPTDLVRVMDWLRRHTESGPGAEARAILSRNSGIFPADAAGWRWIGHKGGSVPGVLGTAMLLQGEDGCWYALVVFWNDPTSDVERARFATLVSHAAGWLAPPRTYTGAPNVSLCGE